MKQYPFMHYYLSLRFLAHILIRFYQLTFSSIAGRTCRYIPSCSYYTDEAIQKHGFWAGGWMGFARICRCTPFGSSGLDPVPDALPEKSAWYLPWRYGLWCGVHTSAQFSCDNCQQDIRKE